MVQRSMCWEDLETSMPGPFKSVPFYDEADDSITIYFSPRESYRERIDHVLTVYRAFDNDEIVGCHVKDVAKIMQEIQAFHIGIEAKSMTLGLLIMAAPWVVGEPEQLKIRDRRYREVMEVAGSIPLPELMAAA